MDTKINQTEKVNALKAQVFDLLKEQGTLSRQIKEREQQIAGFVDQINKIENGGNNKSSGK